MVRIGLVGAGMVGQIAHLANFTELAECRVVALAELRPQLGALAAQKFGVPKVYPTHRELLADDEVDAVVVVTRRPATGPIVLDALRAGKHVLSEKPMAHTVEQAQRLVSAAEERGLVYAVGFMKRYDAGVLLAKRLLGELQATGELGELSFVRAHNFAGGTVTGSGGFVMTDEERSEGLELWPTAPDWLPPERRPQFEEFLNVYLHTVNLVRFIAGERPAVAFAELTHRRGQIVGLEYGPFGAVLELGNIPSVSDWDEGIEIFFERGKLTLALPQPFLRGAPATVQLYRNDANRGTTTYTPEASWAFRRQAEAFVRAVSDRVEPAAGGRDAAIDLELVESAFALL